ncbi:hypothetical protein N9948_01765 [bacterium]|nr:hypothetical protein [bacterium]
MKFDKKFIDLHNEYWLFMYEEYVDRWLAGESYQKLEQEHRDKEKEKWKGTKWEK